MNNKATKEIVLGVVADLVGAFLYYDRKGCEDLPRGKIEELIANGDISVEDIVKQFERELTEQL